MLLFAASIFLSAFLLFQIQPAIGKFLLPWFGGTPAVWSTVLLFFQVLLTAGYAYAYWLIGRVRAPRQAAVHLALIVSAVAVLLLLAFVWDSPITPDPGWKPEDVRSPVLDIFRLLIVSVGLPYFLLAANGPLMQAWFSRLFPKRSYARLYALSNAGSLLGLLAYPVLIEPHLSLRGQGWAWSAGFVCFGLLAGWIALRSGGETRPAQPEVGPVSRADRPSFALTSLWIALSATASLFLLSVTNQISQEVAVIPFLWVLPLGLYLLSFILTFSGERAYNRKFYAALFVIAVGLTLFVMLNVTALQVYWQILAYCLLLFSACMLCHGELYLLRPPARYLTTFYLMVSIGGAFGGIFVSLVAPVIFNGYWELFVGLAMAVAILLAILRPSHLHWHQVQVLRGVLRGVQGRATKNSPAISERPVYQEIASSLPFDELRVAPRNDIVVSRARFVFFTFALVTVMLALLSSYFSGALYARRNFYGVIRVRELIPQGSTHTAFIMQHGITVHGLQFVDRALRNVPTTYYVPEAGAGLAIRNHPKYGHGESMHVGLLGLGVGTLAAYAQPGDEYRLYEINPVVVELAAGQGSYFSFLSDSKADIEVILGDARISLERELSAGHPQNFDVLVLDTFSSDSIPVHLVTKEAFALYLEHLAPDGVIAAHITNLHLDLQPVFWQLAQYYDLHMVRVDYPGDSNGGYASHWILLARDPALLEIPAIQERAVDPSSYSSNIRLWTDDYSNLFQILK